MGVFTSTFLFCLITLLSVHVDTSQNTLLVVCVVALLLLLASVIFFISLVQRLSQLQISNVLNTIGNFGRQEISEMYIPLPADQSAVPKPLALMEVHLLPVSQVVFFTVDLRPLSCWIYPGWFGWLTRSRRSLK